MPALMRSLDLEGNDFGFCRTEPLAPTRTSSFGVFASGAFAEPKDIADTVIQASAAALEASRLISLYAGPSPGEEAPEPVYRRVEQEAPSTLVVLCEACPTLEQSVDIQELTDKLQHMATVQSVARVPQACTEAGWQHIEEKVSRERPNRIVIGACLPYAHVPRLRQLGQAVALNPAFMDVVDIYTPTFPDMPLSQEQRLQEIITSLGAAVVKVQHASPAPLLPAVPVVPKALVVGGGLAGMTAALAIADHGLEVCLVEEGSELGGTAAGLRFTLEGADPLQLIQDLEQQVRKHPHIHVLTECRVALSTGRAGGFLSAVQTGEGQTLNVEHGATILATGAVEAQPRGYGRGPGGSVFSQLQLEDWLASGALDAKALSGVIMIQCAACRQEPRNYCSRVCCATSIKHALILKKRNPRLPVYILYRDMMTYGFRERHFTEARRSGVVFIRYSPEYPPEVEHLEHGCLVRVWDHVLQRFVEIPADTLVLASGMVPRDTEELRMIFRVQADGDGFLQEAESKWRPVECLRQGVFLCGTARAPGDMRETVASAKAAAQRALRLLSHERLTGGTITAEIRHSLCSLCQTCIEACPYGARSVDWEREMIRVDEILCQGCGACTAVCPNSAAVLRGFPDDRVLAEIDAALGVLP